MRTAVGVGLGSRWPESAAAVSIALMNRVLLRRMLLGAVLASGGLVAACAGQAAVQPAHTQVVTASAFVRATQRAFSFTQGHGGAVMYVYFDPNCIYCHELYDHLQKYIRAGQVTVSWIPVAFLKRDSVGKAEAILAAPDPARALARNEEGFDEASEEGAIAPAVNPATAVVAAIYFNTRLLSGTGRLATPTLVFADRTQGVQIIPGMPQNMGPIIRNLVSLPAVPGN